MEKLKYYFTSKYPGYKAHFTEGYNNDSSEMLTGILVQHDDYTLQKALVFFYNTNYNVREVVVKPFPR